MCRCFFIALLICALPVAWADTGSQARRWRGETGTSAILFGSIIAVSMCGCKGDG